MALFSEGECRDLFEQLLALSRADELELALEEADGAHLRFARNVPSTGGVVHTRSLTVRSTFGTRSASARGNQLDRRSLETLVRRSEELARRAPEDEEFMPALGPQHYARVEALEPESASTRGATLARGVELCLDRARAAGLVAAGFVQSEARVRALANSSGLFGYCLLSGAHLSQTARTSDGRGSGWASSAAARSGELDFEGVAQRSCAKAAASAGARPLAPGTFPALLEPACVASLLGLFVRALDARAADEGRSFLTRGGGATRLGERLAPSWLGLSSGPLLPGLPCVPWGDENLPLAATDWLRAGTLCNLHTSRFWAARTGRAALAPPRNLSCSGGQGTPEELLRSLERGLLITDLWYIREVDPRTLLYTGLTRDGVFWVEQGEIAHPVNNFRWNESPLRMLANAQAASAAQRLGGRGGDASHMLVPALTVSEFALTSVSDAV
jgi:predicted Zn-dependent protease